MYGRTIPGSIDPFLAERPASSAGRRDQTSAIFSSVRPLVAPAVHVIGRSSWRDEIPANASWWNKWVGQSAVRQVTCELQFVRICGSPPPRVLKGHEAAASRTMKLPVATAFSSGDPGAWSDAIMSMSPSRIPFQSASRSFAVRIGGCPMTVGGWVGVPDERCQRFRYESE